MVICWSCGEDPLKWDKKNQPSLHFVFTDWMSLLSTPDGENYDDRKKNGRFLQLFYNALTRMTTWDDKPQEEF